MKIVHCKKEPYSSYIGRGSIFGNPYVIGQHGTREECVGYYKQWFNFIIRDKRFLDEVLKLKGQTLGCFCFPGELCHGQVIVDFINQYYVRQS